MRGLLVTALLAAAIVSGCGDEYQPWPKTAGDTTCAEWIDQMSVEQRIGLGRALLNGMWDRDGAAATPDDATVTRFANAVGGTCGAYRTDKVSTVASTLYVLSDDVKP